MNKIESAYKEMMGTCSPSMIAYCMKDKALELERELTAARAEIERLDTVGIHSCHDNCQRWTCVLRRERDELATCLASEKITRNHIVELASETERELAAVTYQRDRLAEACKKLMAIIGEPNSLIDDCWVSEDEMDEAWNIADEALQSLTKKEL